MENITIIEQKVFTPELRGWREGKHIKGKILSKDSLKDRRKRRLAAKKARKVNRNK